MGAVSTNAVSAVDDPLNNNKKQQHQDYCLDREIISANVYWLISFLNIFIRQTCNEAII